MKLSIDPSVNNIGVCIYHPHCEDYEWMLLKPLKHHDLTEKLEWIRREIIKLVGGRLERIEEIICEYPQFFNSQKGAVAATQGYTLDLACICGFMAGICKFAKCYYYTPIKWKGNLTKKAIERRFQRNFPDVELPSEHEQEAIMMMKYHNSNGR